MAATKTAFSPDQYQEFPLESIQEYNHNTNIFRVKFPDPEQVSGLTTASFIQIKGLDKEGEEAERPYTPVSTTDTRGHCDFLIKRYPDGNVSKYVHSRKVGDTLSIKGPFHKLDYETNMKKRIGMIAGGTGITPMVQMLQAIFGNSEDTTQVTMVYANIEEKDILWREHLEEYAQKFPDRFDLHLVLEKPSDSWSGEKGRIDTDMARKLLPSPGDETLILFCGPPPMCKAVAGEKAPDKSQGEVGGVLAELNYTKPMVYKF